MSSWLEWLLAAGAFIVEWLVDEVWDALKDDLGKAAFVVAWVGIRAAGKTVQSGNQGLLFTLGRVRRVLEPGFHFLVPFAQVVRMVPTRSRTLDIPKQVVTTFDGLVYLVDANLVYRVADLRRALVEVDDLQHGLLQVLGLSVQEVLRGLSRGDLRVSADLDAALVARMQKLCEPWGVVVESAGVTSLAPSPVTLRLTQLAARVAERRALQTRLVASGLTPRTARPLAARGVLPRRRHQRAARLEWRSRRRRRVVIGVRLAAAIHGVRELRVVRGAIRDALATLAPRHVA